jgi:hypothetical protein
LVSEYAGCVRERDSVLVQLVAALRESHSNCTFSPFWCRTPAAHPHR